MKQGKALRLWLIVSLETEDLGCFEYAGMHSLRPGTPSVNWCPERAAETLNSAADFREAWSQAVRGETSRSLPWGIRSSAAYRKGTFDSPACVVCSTEELRGAFR